uniref:Uncharacterized protein n=1 Tax=Leptospirillum ferrodiazotrophum TaxID=412449 RepID=C6I169_9BACT|nr:MAG: hypothetical protein UBAL3_96780009 [Leptospirillum ferrodiazotrophum]
MFGQRFCPNFLDEGDTIRSETEWLQDLNSQGVVDFSILVKKDTGKTIIHFEYCDNENQTYRNTDYPSISSLMVIPNSTQQSLFFRDLLKKRRSGSLNGSFIDWSAESADLFLSSVAEILARKKDKKLFSRFDVECFLDLVIGLDWGKDEKKLPEKSFRVLAEHAFSSTRNPFFKSPLRYRYSDKCVGINAKELASFCLATGRLPNERDLEHFSKKHSCSLSLGDTLVMEQ